MLRAAIALAVLATLVWAGGADSQSKRQPSKAQPIQTQNTPPAQATAPDQRGTDKEPLTVKVLPAPQSKEDAERAEREAREESDGKKLADETESLAHFTGALFVVTGLLFAAALGQIGLFWWQLKIIRASLADAKTTANAAKDAAEATSLLARHTQTTERAYIKISHPGTGLILTCPTTIRAHVIGVGNFGIANCGKTPADVHTICIYANIVPKDGTVPAYGEPQAPEPAFMVVDDEVFVERHYVFSASDIARVFTGESLLVVHGYAEYTDAFGNRHKGGYGRMLSLETGRLDFTTMGHLNYDEPASNE